MRSEIMLEHYGVTEENWRDGATRNPHFAAISESPRFVGRAVAALAADPDVVTGDMCAVSHSLYGLGHDPVGDLAPTPRSRASCSPRRRHAIAGLAGADRAV